MKKMNLVILAALLVSNFSTTAFAQEGGVSTGGGGGICINGKCLTLAEAGIRVSANSPSEKIWYVTPSVTSELQALTDQMPFGGEILFKMTIGELETFVEVDKIAPDFRKKIQSEYKQVFKQIGKSPMFENFVLFAASSSSKTYLLPEFFNLSHRQKALKLIHEGIVRKTNGNFLKAMEFDGLLLDYLNRSQIPEYTPLAFNHLIEELTGVKNPEKNQNNSSILNEAILTYVEKRIGRRLRLTDFLMDEDITIYYNSTYFLRDRPQQMRVGINLMSEWFHIFGSAKLNYVDAGQSALIRFGDAELVEACRGIDTTPVQTMVGKSWNRSVVLIAYDPMTFVNCGELKDGKVYGLALKIEGLKKVPQAKIGN